MTKTLVFSGTTIFYGDTYAYFKNPEEDNQYFTYFGISSRDVVRKIKEQILGMQEEAVRKAFVK